MAEFFSLSEIQFNAGDEFIRLMKPMSEETKRKGQLAGELADASHVQRFLDDLSTHGMFLVPNGALESWLPGLEVPSGPNAKDKWLSRIFERMGRNAEDPHYVQPGEDDVWAFLDRIAAWVAHYDIPKA